LPFKLDNPRPGDFGLVRISGLTGVAVDLGQRLTGSGSYFTHAFLVMDGRMVLQGQPGGAEYAYLDDAVGNRPVVYSDFALTDDQRASIVAAGDQLHGTPYSFLDYPAIGAARLLGMRRLELYVQSTKHMICSQVVETAYRNGGFDLFPNRIAGDVEPGDLAHRIGAKRATVR
jgi:hypothetical protein